jgi:hypothetical protein
VPVSDPETREEDSVLRVYNRIRKYIEHEDKLINDRISRTLLVHGFLLASGVLLVQSRVEAAAKCMGRDQGCWPQATASNAHLLAPEQLSIVLLLVDVLLPVIAMIGVVTTRAALRGVAAAEESVTSVRQHWQRFASEHRGAIDRLHLPGVTGGGLAKAEEKGHGSSINLLRHLFVLWFLIFLLNVGLGFVWHWPEVKSWPFVAESFDALKLYLPR